MCANAINLNYRILPTPPSLIPHAGGLMRVMSLRRSRQTDRRTPQPPAGPPVSPPNHHDHLPHLHSASDCLVPEELERRAISQCHILEHRILGGSGTTPSGGSPQDAGHGAPRSENRKLAQRLAMTAVVISSFFMINSSKYMCLSQYLSDFLVLIPKVDWLIALFSVALLTLVFSLGDNSSSALSPWKSIPRNLLAHLRHDRKTENQHLKTVFLGQVDYDKFWCDMREAISLPKTGDKSPSVSEESCFCGLGMAQGMMLGIMVAFTLRSSLHGIYISHTVSSNDPMNFRPVGDANTSLNVARLLLSDADKPSPLDLPVEVID
ncbi:hypothetical protein BS47DRAFT_1388985 [Hydnum rufescens UP504]|uniref:Uncharacterized protein n=1 Tax=Hydnum rufescens UP504 TaxID=1448309 RepID=A0A9P6B6E0_9AGAM|nr:hypothetical protein BS47DRAFT_1388985 [Hydnum rufescens UP504]